MQMELLKKPVRSYRTIEIRETEEMLENSIIVPDSKPDVRNILLADAECFVTSIEKTGRMIEVGGEIRYRILYCADTPDNRLECIVIRYPWSTSLQKPKAEGEMGLFAKCRCQHTEASVVNGRKIVARNVTSLVCRFYELKVDEIGREILGENVFLKTRPVNIIALKDNGDVTAKFSNILSLPHGSPAIKEVLFSRLNMGHADISVRDDECSLESKGTLNILYRSDTMDESIESVVLEFPIKTAVGVQPGDDNLVFSTSVLKNWELDVLEDNDGLNTQVAINMEIEIDSQAMAQEEQVIIEDAYSTDCLLNLNKKPVNIISDEKELSENYEINQRVRLETNEGQMDEVFMVCANERNIASMVNDRNVNVQGTIGIDTVFSTNNNEIMSQSVELPFNQTFNWPDSDQWSIVQTSFNIEDVSFDISGNDSIEVSIKLKIKLRIAKVEELVCADTLNVTKDENERKSPIILYFAQPNDTLWSIAKHYRIPLSRLAQENGLDASDKIEVGRKLFIMA